MGRVRKFPPKITKDEWNALIDDYVSASDTTEQVISSDIVPNMPNTLRIGESGSSFGEIHAVNIYGNVHYADAFFKDLNCPICSHRFSVGELIGFLIISASPQEIRTIPAHVSCLARKLRTKKKLDN